MLSIRCARTVSCLATWLDRWRTSCFMVEGRRRPRNFAQHLPWEFLLYVVDHRTPLTERAWAFQYFAGPHRQGRPSSAPGHRLRQGHARDGAGRRLREEHVRSGESRLYVGEYQEVRRGLRHAGRLRGPRRQEPGSAVHLPLAERGPRAATTPGSPTCRSTRPTRRALPFDLLSDGRYAGFERAASTSTSAS